MEISPARRADLAMIHGTRIIWQMAHHKL